MSGCTIQECGRRVVAKGMCWAHYQRNRRGTAVHVRLGYTLGDKRRTSIKEGPSCPPYRVRRRARLAWELREGSISPEPTTGCFLWMGNYFPATGYGQIGNSRDPWGGYAHRAVLHFAGTAIRRRDMKMHVRHLCNNPACVNPDHLRYGTARENMADRTARIRRGEIPAVGGHTRVSLLLNRDDVQMGLRMWAEGASIREIAQRLHSGRGAVEYWIRSIRECSQ